MGTEKALTLKLFNNASAKVAIPVGDGFKVPKPGNHVALGKETAWVSQPTNQEYRNGMLNLIEDQLEKGHWCVGSDAEPNSSSHNPWWMTFEAGGLYFALDKKDHEIEMAIGKMIQRSFCNHLLHQLPNGDVELEGARSFYPGLEHGVVDQREIRSRVTSYLNRKPIRFPGGFGTEGGLDSISLWFYTRIDIRFPNYLDGLLADVRNQVNRSRSGGLVNVDYLPHHRVPYVHYRSQNEQLGVWNGDLSQMIQPCFWAYARFAPNERRYGCKKNWNKYHVEHFCPKDILPPIKPPYSNTINFPVVKGF
jgi:hypothetical protein